MQRNFQKRLIWPQGGTLLGAAAGLATDHRLDGARSPKAASHVKHDIMGSPNRDARIGAGDRDEDRARFGKRRPVDEVNDDGKTGKGKAFKRKTW